MVGATPPPPPPVLRGLGCARELLLCCAPLWPPAIEGAAGGKASAGVASLFLRHEVLHPCVLGGVPPLQTPAVQVGFAQQNAKRAQHAHTHSARERAARNSQTHSFRERMASKLDLTCYEITLYCSIKRPSHLSYPSWVQGRQIVHESFDLRCCYAHDSKYEERNKNSIITFIDLRWLCATQNHRF
jgi:hypothetical protein